MEGGDREDPQAAQCCFGGAAGGGQEALGIGQLPALQAGQITAHAEEVHVEALQVLLPLLNLWGRNKQINVSQWET